ncbi:Uncharacterised protein [uncultured archaeon]|nr:Uncharacterised protein [uncultured archaeon]
MEGQQSALKSENEAERHRKKLDSELKAQLEKKGLLVEPGGVLHVDLTRIHPYYLPEKYQNRMIQDKKENKPALIRYDEFFEHYYSEYRKGSGMRTPTKFLDLAYGKASFKEGEAYIGAGVGQPISLDKLSFGKPKLTADVGVREREMGQTRGGVEAGVTLEKKAEPYVKAEAGGFFATLVEGVKKITVGISEGIASLTANIAKSVKYLFSLTLGPWIGTINVVTGHVSVAFSWLVGAYGMFMRVVGRLFEDRFEETPYVKSMYIGKGELKKGEKIEGEYEGKKVSLDIKEVKDGVLTDGKGDEYKVEREYGGRITLHRKLSFWSNLGHAFNPVNLVTDVADVAILYPVLRAVDTVDMFKAPKGTVPESEFGKYEKKIEDAEKRGNFHTARYFARLLVASSRGVKKAEYMLELDRIEWKLAGSGLFIGYVQGSGFGNKRNMVNKEIEARIRENMDVIRNAKKAGEDFNAAQAYLGAKLENMKEGGLGRIAPREQPFPAHLADELWELMKTRGDRMEVLGMDRKVQVDNANFTAIKPNDGFSDAEKKDWTRLMSLLQRTYDGTKYRDDAGGVYYNLMKSGRDTETYKGALLAMAKNRLARNKTGLQENAAEIPKEKAAEMYEMIFIQG